MKLHKQVIKHTRVESSMEAEPQKPKVISSDQVVTLEDQRAEVGQRKRSIQVSQERVGHERIDKVRSAKSPSPKDVFLREIMTHFPTKLGIYDSKSREMMRLKPETQSYRLFAEPG